MMQRAEAQRVRNVLADAKKLGLPFEEISVADIVIRFKEAARELTWERAKRSVGLEFGLTDETGRPLHPRYAKIIAQGKKAYMSERRLFLIGQRTFSKF